MSEDQNGVADQEGSSTVDAQALADKYKAEAEKFRNEYLYLRADFDNYKKAVIKERADQLKYGSERIFVEVLEVIDNFERALGFDVTPENLSSFTKGVRLIRDELKSLLGRFSVAEMPALGEKFDPNLHNAIGTEPTDKMPSGHVSQVFKKPYKLHDRVIRPGQVIIATDPKPTES